MSFDINFTSSGYGSDDDEAIFPRRQDVGRVAGRQVSDGLGFLGSLSLFDRDLERAAMSTLQKIERAGQTLQQGQTTVQAEGVRSDERFRGFEEQVRQASVNFEPLVPQPAQSEAAMPVGEQERPALCTRPTFSEAQEAYNRVRTIPQLTEEIGGTLSHNFEAGFFQNGCASRISYVLNQTGCEVPKISGETVSGRSSEQYIYRLSTLRPHLREVFGPPDCKWNKNQPSGQLGAEKCTSLKGKAGILVEEWPPSSSCTGHAYLIGKDDKDTPPGTGLFWQLRPDPPPLGNTVLNAALLAPLVVANQTVKLAPPPLGNTVLNAAQLAPLVVVNQTVKLAGRLLQGACWLESKNPINQIMPSVGHLLCQYGPKAAHAAGQTVAAAIPEQIVDSTSKTIAWWNGVGNDLVKHYNYLPEWYVRSAHEGALDSALFVASGATMTAVRTGTRALKVLQTNQQIELRRYARKKITERSTNVSLKERMRCLIYIGPTKGARAPWAVASIARKKLIKDGAPAYNITSASSAAKYPVNMSGGRPQTFVTDQEGIIRALGTSIDVDTGVIHLTNRQWGRLTKKLGIPAQKQTMQNEGAVLSEILDAGERNIRFPKSGNNKFKGHRKGTSGGLFEAVIDPISNRPDPSIRRHKILSK